MQPIKIVPARERITATLRKAILAGEYQSGQELSLTQIASDLGVSRTPVREAFQTLAAEGFIDLRMNKGAIVKNIDEKFVTDHFEMRILLEGEAVYRATNRHYDVSKLLADCQYAADNPQKFSLQDYTALNQQIHTSIWKAADNQRLYELLKNFWNGPSVSDGNELTHHLISVQEHIKMLTLMKSGNAKEAREVMTDHIKRSMNNILQSFQDRKL
ncbi:MAG: GntR family transcriptional regulator [Lactobacillus sp.]|jgi:DNA-binding GntR family transcriptional regulator|nr:GntR family transcriptional regulator [Lactobacillus sp.]MCI2031879.1 GntR family transcriptional regulator [Lactobacillus sp.]